MTTLTLSVALALCATVLAVFLALPLLALARQRPASGWLAMFVYSVGALSFCDSQVARIPTFGFFDWPVAGLGAFYYCYVRSLTGLGNGRRQLFHFVPMLIAMVAFAWMHTVLVAIPPGGSTSAFWDGLFQGVLVVSQALAVSYVGAVLFRLRQHRRRVRECYSLTDQRDLVWLAWLTVVTLVLLIVWVPATLLGGGLYWALGVGRVALLFFVGWYGLRQAAVFLPILAANESAGAAAGASAVIGAEPVAGSLLAPAEIPAAVPGSPAEPAKYARSGMTDAAAKLIAQRLEQRMQGTHDYLENDITLAQLAERIGTSPQLLSQYLNHALSTSFFDYINGLRVAEVQRNLRDHAAADQPLLQLAFAAGFNSKSTFNAAFKKMTGSAPSTWRAAQLSASEPIR